MDHFHHVYVRALFGGGGSFSSLFMSQSNPFFTKPRRNPPHVDSFIPFLNQETKTAAHTTIQLIHSSGRVFFFNGSTFIQQLPQSIQLPYCLGIAFPSRTPIRDYGLKVRISWEHIIVTFFLLNKKIKIVSRNNINYVCHTVT